jgi:hypothetical protein
LQHSFLMSWRATLILKQRGIVSMAACVGDMKARMALCCIACRKCRDNVYRRSITLSLPFFLTATYIWLKTHRSLRASSYVLVTACILLNLLNRFWSESIS